MHTGVPSADKIAAKPGLRNFVLFLKCKSDASVTGNSSSVVVYIIRLDLHRCTRYTHDPTHRRCVRLNKCMCRPIYRIIIMYILKRHTSISLPIITYDNTPLQVLSRLRVNLGVHIIILYTIRIEGKD